MPLGYASRRSSPVDAALARTYKLASRQSLRGTRVADVDSAKFAQFELLLVQPPPKQLVS